MTILNFAAKIGRGAIRFWKRKVVGALNDAGARATYVSACTKRIAPEYDFLQRNLTDKRRAEANQRVEFFSHARHEKFSNKENSDETRLRHWLQGQWNEINQISHVCGACVSGNNLMVRTDSLAGVRPRTNLKYALGTFLIVINLDGSDEPVRWFNQTRHINGIAPRMQAPTVFEDGSCAAGEMKETLIELVAQLELSTAVELAIQYVQSPDNPILEEFAKLWPRVA